MATARPCCRTSEGKLRGMSLIAVHVAVHVKPEVVDAFRAATLVNARASVQEPGIARFDVMQFERIEDVDADEADLDEAFDPSTLLIVLGALVRLVDGIGVDPQSGLIV